MRTHWSILTAAALAVGSFGLSNSLAQQADQAAQPTAGQQIENAAEKTGNAGQSAVDTTGEALGLKRDATASPHAEEINDVLAQVTEAALTKAALDDMAERFVDADRNRLGQGDALKQGNRELDGRIAQFQQDWKAKYNQHFDIADEDKVYSASFVMITEGEIGDRAKQAGAQIGADAQGKTGVDAPKVNTDGNIATDRNLNDPGRNVATVTILESHGMPALVVPLVHEAGGWKIDIPDTVDAAKLRDNVQAALTRCDQKKAEWPASSDDAYRAVTHEVLLAIFDQKVDAAQKASRQLPGDYPRPAQPAQPAAPGQPDPSQSR